MFLRTALEQIPGIDTVGRADVNIHGISYDSRACGEGYLFVAIKGEKSDGACFIRQAASRGAVAIAAESPIDLAENIARVTVPDARRFLADISRIYYGDPASKLELAAVTGTNGKTTTTYLLDSQQCRNPLLSYGNDRNEGRLPAGPEQAYHAGSFRPDPVPAPGCN